MKKKIISFLMSLCMVLPFAVVFSACTPHEHEPLNTWEHDATHHWHKCKDESCEETLDKATHTLTTVTVTPATIDTEGSEKQVCDCGYETTPTTTPKVVQSTDDMISVLHTVANKDDSYTYIKTEESNNFSGLIMPGSDSIMTSTTHMAKRNGTLVSYTTAPIEKAPATWEADDYFSEEVHYLVDGTENDELYILQPNDPLEPTDIEVKSKLLVGENYIANATADHLDETFSFARHTTTEAEIEEGMKGAVVELIDNFANTMFSYGTVDKNDIDVNVSTTYANQKYSITVTVSTDDITYKTGTVNRFEIDSLTLTYTGEYTKDTVLKLQGDVEMDVTLCTDTADTSDDTPYSATSRTIITPSTNVDDATPHLEKIASYTADDSHTAHSIREQLSIYVDDMLLFSDSYTYTDTLNTVVDDYLSELNTTYDGVATFTAYLDEDMTIPYVPTEDLLAEHYYGANVYIKLTLLDSTKAVIYTTYNTNMYGMMNMPVGTTMDIVDAGEYTIETEYSDATFDNALYIDYVPTASTTMTAEAGQTYKVVCEMLISFG